MNFYEMSDEDVKVEAKRIANTSYSDDQIRRRLAVEIGYPWPDSVAISSIQHGDSRMTMGMMWGPSGHSISF